MNACRTFIVNVSRKSFTVTLDLFKLMIPIIILIKIAKELGAIDYLGYALYPIMDWLGLPGSMGIVWASTMLSNLYGGAAVFMSLASDENLTVAQITVLGTIMSFSHALLLEAAITQRAGVRFSFIIVIRLVLALIYGIALNQLLVWGDWLQYPLSLNLLEIHAISEPTLWQWALVEIENLARIALIILCLFTLLEIFEKLKVNRLLEICFKSALTKIGIKPAGIPLTITGMLMGLTYGGALVVREVNSGLLDRRTILFSILLMTLVHGVIEDTMLMWALGVNIFWVLIARLVFVWIFLFVLNALLKLCDEPTFNRYFFNKRGAQAMYAMENAK